MNTIFNGRINIIGVGAVQALGSLELTGASANAIGYSNLSTGNIFVANDATSANFECTSTMNIFNTNVIPFGTFIIGQSVRAAKVLADDRALKIVPVGTLGVITAIQITIPPTHDTAYIPASMTINFGNEFGNEWQLLKRAYSYIIPACS